MKYVVYFQVDADVTDAVHRVVGADNIREPSSREPTLEEAFLSILRTRRSTARTSLVLSRANTQWFSTNSGKATAT